MYSLRKEVYKYKYSKSNTVTPSHDYCALTGKGYAQIPKKIQSQQALMKHFVKTLLELHQLLWNNRFCLFSDIWNFFANFVDLDICIISEHWFDTFDVCGLTENGHKNYVKLDTASMRIVGGNLLQFWECFVDYSERNSRRMKNETHALKLPRDNRQKCHQNSKA